MAADQTATDARRGHRCSECPYCGPSPACPTCGSALAIDGHCSTCFLRRLPR